MSARNRTWADLWAAELRARVVESRRRRALLESGDAQERWMLGALGRSEAQERERLDRLINDARTELALMEQGRAPA